MHPDDAARLQLNTNDSVRVSSSAGSVEVPVHLTEDMMPGSVALPHGWGHQGYTGQQLAAATTGANVNILTADGPESIEPLSGMTQFNGIRVMIEKIKSDTGRPVNAAR